MSIADNVSFELFCQVCAKITSAVRDKKTDAFRNFIENWKRKGEELKKDDPQTDCSFFPALRLLLPHCDKERGAYGVRESTIAKIYIRILCLPKDGTDATKLLEFRAPKSAGSLAGDFAEVAYYILKNRCSSGGELSILDVNNHLDAIATKNANGDPRGVDAELTAIVRKASAEEQKWIIRILLKNMRLGIGQNIIFNIYHPDARDLYDVSNNLKKVCDTLRDPKIRLNEVEVEVFSPIRPMLSEECDVKKVDVQLKSCPYFYIETKLDGERFQMHTEKGNYKYFSRNGFDYTANFGKSRLEGTLTPLIAKQLPSNVDSLILDGEMMCWDPGRKCYASKAMNTDVKNLKDGSYYKPCFCVFDILYLNGQILTNKPLNYRVDKLNEVVEPLEGVLTIVSRKRISTKEEIWDSLNDAIDNREEGIVMKEFLSVYKPNARKKGGWYKIKPEYTDGLMDYMDVVIIGGYFGGGRRGGNISHFLLGVAVPKDDGGEPEEFHSVARVGSGYTMEELAELQNKLQPHWQKYAPGTMPTGIIWTKEKPDLWIEPSKSFILQIKASEIMQSDLYKTGYTFRFPRVEKVRYDKSWNECLTTVEFEEKRMNASGKLFSGHLSESNTSESSTGIKLRRNTRSQIQIGVQFKPTNVSKVTVLSKLLEGKEFCVFSGFADFNKCDVEKKIAEYGGTFVQNPGLNTFCVLAEEESTVRIKNLVLSKTHNVVKTSWFISNLNSETSELPELKPPHLIGMSHKTWNEISKTYDKWGDHFTIPATEQSLQSCFEVIERKVKKDIGEDDKYEMDIELFSGPSPYSLFRLCTAYLDRYPILEDPTSGALSDLEICAFEFLFYGGTCYDTILEEVSHVIVSKNDLTRLEELKSINRKRSRKFHIVTDVWVQCCVEKDQLLNEENFHPDGLISNR